MNNPRFPFHRLPNDLCSKVLQAMDLHERIAYSFVSKKAHSMVKPLYVPIECGEIEMKKSTEIRLIMKNFRSIYFTLRSAENDGKPTSLHDLPVCVEVSKVTPENEYVTWSNQGLSFEQWIQHISSIFKHEGRLHIIFRLGQTRLTIPSFRNTFPKLKYLIMTNQIYDHEPTDEDVLYAENVLKVFLPVVEKARLYRVPIREHFFAQHIGMTNLKHLTHSDHNVKFDDLLTLNVETLNIGRAENISLRDLNRFFKLWIKGSFPRLKQFWITVKARIISDFYVLLKGLRAEEAVVEPGEEPEEEIHKRFIIKNCRGVCAEILLQYIDNECYIRLSITD